MRKHNFKTFLLKYDYGPHSNRLQNSKEIGNGILLQQKCVKEIFDWNMVPLAGFAQ